MRARCYMSHMPQLITIPPEQIEYVRETVEREGITRAVRILGFGRSAILGAIALGKVAPGTAALIREAQRRGSEAA